MPTLTIELPEEVRQRLEAVARERGQAPAEVAGALLGPALAAEEARLAGAPSGHDAGTGALAHVPVGSEDLARYRREEVEREEARFRARFGG